ncbi:MAG: Gfo/Idh/MocA family oxidoreductase, partial [Hyphomicrobiales bacterium]
RKMAQTAKASGKKFMMHFNSRFSPEAQVLKEYAESGILGDVYYARTVWNRRRGVPGLGGWFTTKKLSGGGPLIDLGVHRLDLALWLMGNPAAISVSGFCHNKLALSLSARLGRTMDVEDFSAGFVRLDNGAVLSLEASWATNTEKAEDMSTAILGTKGSLFHCNSGDGYRMEAKVVAERLGNVEVVTPKDYVPRYANAQQHFVDCIIDGKEPLATAEHGVRVMEILDALYESAEKGREVTGHSQEL